MSNKGALWNRFWAAAYLNNTFGVGLVLLLLLAGCGDSPTATSDATATTPPILSPVPPSATTNTVIVTTGPGPTATTTSNPVTTAAPPPASGATVTPVAPIQPAATTGPGSLSAREQVQKALAKLANEAGSFRYKLQQQGDLKSGNSLTHFEANGDGAWQRPAFRQLVTLRFGGDQKQIELYGRDKQLYQRTLELVVWRKQEPGAVGPFPDAGRLTQAGNFQQPGKETINGVSALKLTWEEAAGRWLPSAGQPEGLGALSATNIYLAFVADKAPVQLALWVSEADGLPLRYQLTANLTAGSDTLRYIALYDYSGFNDSTIKVDAPADLIK